MNNFEMGKKDDWVPCLVHPSWVSAPVTAFELFYNSIICRKVIAMQMIFVHRNANEFCPG